MMLNGFIPGYGDSLTDLLAGLTWQIDEKRRALELRATTAEHQLRRLRMAIMDLNAMAMAN